VGVEWSRGGKREKFAEGKKGDGLAADFKDRASDRKRPGKGPGNKGGKEKRKKGEVSKCRIRKRKCE